MKREMIINRQGKDFVLYAGLLDHAHDNGLVKIETEAVTVTSNIAVFKATATFSDGKVFSSHGDATPENVGRAIIPHFVRMAETRAKARALRDALNIGAASIEELMDEDIPQAPVRQPPPRPVAQPTPIRPAPAPSAEPVTSEGWEKVQAARAEMGAPASDAAAAKATPTRNPALSGLWERAETAVAALREKGVKGYDLPTDDADQTELETFLADARGAYANAAKAKQGVR
jgi:hypothetical protein